MVRLKSDYEYGLKKIIYKLGLPTHLLSRLFIILYRKTEMLLFEGRIQSYYKYFEYKYMHLEAECILQTSDGSVQTV